jgi:hypothetical protein
LCRIFSWFSDHVWFSSRTLSILTLFLSSLLFLYINFYFAFFLCVLVFYVLFIIFFPFTLPIRASG